MKPQYNRNRPFLAVTFTQRLDNKRQFVTSEKADIIDRVNSNHLINCGVIIDIAQKKCITNILASSDEEVVQLYLTKYQAEIKRAFSIWANQVARAKLQTEIQMAEKQKTIPTNIDGEYKTIDGEYKTI